MGWGGGSVGFEKRLTRDPQWEYSTSEQIRSVLKLLVIRRIKGPLEGGKNG